MPSMQIIRGSKRDETKVSAIVPLFHVRMLQPGRRPRCDRQARYRLAGRSIDGWQLFWKDCRTVPSSNGLHAYFRVDADAGRIRILHRLSPSPGRRRLSPRCAGVRRSHYRCRTRASAGSMPLVPHHMRAGRMARVQRGRRAGMPVALMRITVPSGNAPPCLSYPCPSSRSGGSEWYRSRSLVQ